MNPLDLEALKAALAMSSMWGSYHFKWASFMTGWPTRQQQESLAIICNAAPALIDELERLRKQTASALKTAKQSQDVCAEALNERDRLRQQLATAKAVGAAEICADADKYYVYSQQDAKAGYAGGSIVWWRGGGHGYARDLKGAGVFTIEDYLQGYPNPNHCVYVPCNRVVDAAFKSETLVWAKHLPKARQLAKEIETRAAELRKQDPK